MVGRSLEVEEQFFRNAGVYEVVNRSGASLYN